MAVLMGIANAQESNPIIEHFINFLRYPEPKHQQIIQDIVLVRNKNGADQMIDAYQRVDYKAIAEFTSKSVINLAEYIKAN